MLAKSAKLPTRPGHSYEPKLDGFRAVLSAEGGFRVYSLRRWNMTPLLPELETFPLRRIFDGGLDDERRREFPPISPRRLAGLLDLVRVDPGRLDVVLPAPHLGPLREGFGTE